MKVTKAVKKASNVDAKFMSNHEETELLERKNAMNNTF